MRLSYRSSRQPPLLLQQVLIVLAVIVAASSFIIVLLPVAAAAQEGEEEEIINNNDVIVPNTDNIEMCNVPSLSEIAGIDAEQSCIENDGITRCWYTYVPDSVKELSNNDDANVTTTISVPLVLDLHGYNLCASQSAQYTGWNRIAQKHGFIVVYPQGNLNAEYSTDPSWDFGTCCSFVGTSAPVTSATTANNETTTDDVEWPPPANINDTDFLRQVVSNVVSSIDSSSSEQGVIKVDTKRIYFAGHSNGCMMSQAMAALESDLVTAVCCQASSLMVPPADNYIPTSVQVVYGDLDNTFDMFFGSESHFLETWGKINRCNANASTEVAETGLYATHTLSNCTNDTVVETVEVYNVGHFPYLGIPPENEFTVAEYPGAVTPEVDTTQMSWDFCSSFVSNVEPVLPQPVELVPAVRYVVPIDPTIKPTLDGTNEKTMPPFSSSFGRQSSGLFATLVVGIHALLFCS